MYVTDGDPTAYDFNQPGDPFDPGPTPDVGVNTNRGEADATTMDRAIQEANEAKAAARRVLAVGVGSAVTGNTASIDRLRRISGPQVVTTSTINTITSINQVDVALLAVRPARAFLRSIVSELCSPSLSIRKLAETADNAAYTPAPNWDITVTPDGPPNVRLDSPGHDRCGNAAVCNVGTPAGTPPVPPAQRWRPAAAHLRDESDRSGKLPVGAGIRRLRTTSAVVTEALQPGYTAGRPGSDNDFVCTVKNIDGRSRRVGRGVHHPDDDPHVHAPR